MGYNAKAIASKFIDEELRGRPISLAAGCLETEIMEYLGMEPLRHGYFSLDSANSKKVNDVKSAVMADPRVIQKEIQLEEELEDDALLDNMWIIHKDTPTSIIKQTVREWNDSILNDPDLDWDPFDPGREKLK